MFKTKNRHFNNPSYRAESFNAFSTGGSSFSTDQNNLVLRRQKMMLLAFVSLDYKIYGKHTTIGLNES